jgi:hypothetical protein
MVAYWRMRRKVFGDERAFLPMAMVGGGAFREEEDLSIVEKGIVGVLPNDEHGRGVLYYDRIRAVPPLASRDGVVGDTCCLDYLIYEPGGCCCVPEIDTTNEFTLLSSFKASRLVLFDANPVGRCHVAKKGIRHDLSHQRL